VPSTFGLCLFHVSLFAGAPPHKTVSLWEERISSAEQYSRRIGIALARSLGKLFVLEARHVIDLHL
jgi:hypothetical protein